MGFLSWLFGRKPARDGASPATAIIVNSVGEEYAWVQRNCPGFHPEMQALQHIHDKPFDVLTLCNDGGDKRIVYFDISSFFGRW